MGGKAGVVKSKGCCDNETVIPSGIMEREEFCAVKAKGRKCTDCFCCLIFLVFMAAWVACFAIGMTFGDQRSLIYARDYKGRLCGGDLFLNETLTYYPRLKDDLLEYALALLGDISNLDIYSLMDAIDFDLLNLTGVCVHSCPQQYDVVCTSDYLELYPKPTLSEVSQCQGGDPVSALLELAINIPKNQYFLDNPIMCASCWPVWLETTDVFFRCFDIITTFNDFNEVCTHPDMTNVSVSDPSYIAADDNRCLTKHVANYYDSEELTYDNPLAKLLGVVMASLNSAASDAENSMLLILGVGIGGAMCLGFLYILFLRLCAGCLIWSTITAFITFLAGSACYCWLMSGYFDTEVITDWLSSVASSIGLESLATAIEVWYNSTTFENENISVSSDFGITVTTDSETLWRVGAFSLSFIFLIVVILTIIVAKKIKIAICIIEEASVAIMRMPCLAFFPFVTAVVIFANFGFAAVSMALLASTEVTWDAITGIVTTALNCSEATNNVSVYACTVLNETADYLTDFDVILTLNFFQFFCFLWMNSVIQGVGIMIVAGAVADWYWTRPSFDPSVKEEEWTQHLEGARSFHGLPEGVFVHREGRWDLMLNVDRLAINDQHIVKYDKTDATHRQLLGMRGYETEPVMMEIPSDSPEQQQLIKHMKTHAAGHPEGLEHVHAGSHRQPVHHKKGLYVRFIMENLAKWKTGLRQGIEEEGEDPRAFYSFDVKNRHCGQKKLAKIEWGLKSTLIPGKVSAPGWGETDKHGIPVWKPESSNYYPLVQDPRGFYGPVDPNFGKIITEPDHQRLNNHYVHQMLMAGKLRKGGNKKDFKSPFLGSLYRTLRFHLGSVCVGAFIIALVQLIRAILLYIDKQTKTWQNRNKCYQCMFKVIHCLMCCLEKCMKYISKNAYIMTAMRGKAFCDACCASFKLLLTNLVQFAIVGIFSKVVIFFGKLFITCAATIGVYLVLKIEPSFSNTTSDFYVNNVFIPSTLTFLLAYAVAAAFLHVYDLAIATILLCFCEDFRYHSVDDASKSADHDEVFMPSSLRNLVLPPASRMHLNHAMTYEEIRVYATHVHKIPDPPHKAADSGYCCGDSNAKVEPASYNVVAKQHTIVDYEGDAAKAKVQSMHDDLAAKEAQKQAMLEKQKAMEHEKLQNKLKAKGSESKESKTKKSKESKKKKRSEGKSSEGKSSEGKVATSNSDIV